MFKDSKTFPIQENFAQEEEIHQQSPESEECPQEEEEKVATALPPSARNTTLNPHPASSQEAQALERQLSLLNFSDEQEKVTSLTDSAEKRSFARNPTMDLFSILRVARAKQEAQAALNTARAEQEAKALMAKMDLLLSSYNAKHNGEEEAHNSLEECPQEQPEQEAKTNREEEEEEDKVATALPPSARNTTLNPHPASSQEAQALELQSSCLNFSDEQEKVTSLTASSEKRSFARNPTMNLYSSLRFARAKQEAQAALNTARAEREAKALMTKMDLLFSSYSAKDNGEEEAHNSPEDSPRSVFGLRCACEKQEVQALTAWMSFFNSFEDANDNGEEEEEEAHNSPEDSLGHHSRSVFALKPRTLTLKDFSSSPPKALSFQGLEGFEDGELQILKHVLGYCKKGGYPFINEIAIDDFTKNWLPVKVSQSEMMEKIERLGKKFLKIVEKMCENLESLEHCDGEVNESANKIWGTLSGTKSAGEWDKHDGEERKSLKGGQEQDLSKYPFLRDSLKSGGNNLNAPNSVLSESIVNVGLKLIGSSKLEELDKHDGEERKNGGQEQDLFKYPFLRESLKSGGNNLNAPKSVLSESIVNGGLNLIGSSKLEELDNKWKQLELDETKLSIKRYDLIKEQTELFVDAVKSLSHS